MLSYNSTKEKIPYDNKYDENSPDKFFINLASKLVYGRNSF